MNQALLLAQLPGLRRYARALTGDLWAADDLVQDTLERACAKWLLWKMDSDLRAWLFTLMHNLYLNQRRSAPAPWARVDLADVEDELPGGSAPADAALDLDRCLRRLPDDQRAVLLLVALEDMSYQQVATVLSVPVGTVMSRLSRARSRLRELMDGPGVAVTAGIPVPLRRLK
jgi:RNA polymerase sigma factor (sigma-70 family)